MPESGFVQIPINDYIQLYEANAELKKLKNDLVSVIEGYANKPQFIARISPEMQQAAWDKVRAKYPEYTFTTIISEEILCSATSRIKVKTKEELYNDLPKPNFDLEV